MTPIPTAERIDAYRWLLPRKGGMRTDGIVFASDRLMRDLVGDPALEQVANVACLPGIVGASLAMPDAHWGYGFAIGGVAAFDAEEGIVSPGGVGYDINCGVRLLRSSLDLGTVRSRMDRLVEALFAAVPTGVGSHRRDEVLTEKEERDLLVRGAAWAVDRGYGWSSDLEAIEAGGVLEGADPDAVSARAIERGRAQVGTVGSGNHFIEVGFVDEVYDEAAASAFGLAHHGVTVLIHSGSRGLGYQVCDDAVKSMVKGAARYGFELPDRQLCCAPLGSEEARAYLAAMACAANYAFANRQRMAHGVREAFEKTFGVGPREHGLHTVYDVCHNVAKFETHEVQGRPRRVLVHRKGATRAFPAGHPDVPERYRAVGQPVLIPGDMGRYSYVLAGAPGAMRETFGSTCHGAGRVMSRTAAKRAARGRSLLQELNARGISIRSAGMATIAEEMPEAYKDVSDVVDVVHGAGLSTKVARVVPMGVIKG
ncbi:MAG: RtcB family protein [Acidobacteriia bacterium]|nr:RtcB family protein [Terriglobia bacterium]